LDQFRSKGGVTTGTVKKALPGSHRTGKKGRKDLQTYTETPTNTPDEKEGQIGTAEGKEGETRREEVLTKAKKGERPTTYFINNYPNLPALPHLEKSAGGKKRSLYMGGTGREQDGEKPE